MCHLLLKCWLVQLHFYMTLLYCHSLPTFLLTNASITLPVNQYFVLFSSTIKNISYLTLSYLNAKQ